MPFALVLVLAQAGGGSSGFGGGGGGGGGGGSFGGGGGGTGGGIGLGLFILFAAVFLIALVISAVAAARLRRRRRERVPQVVLAAAEAAEDDPAFAAEMIGAEAASLFADIQRAWDARDRPRLRALIGGDLLVEWEHRLDDFDAKGWHSRVQLVRDPEVEYVGLVNRATDEEDRAVVRLTAPLDVWVDTLGGQRMYKSGQKGPRVGFAEYAGDGERRTRLVVRGSHVAAVTIEAVDASAQPARMTVAVSVRGRRYREDRATAAIVEGSRDHETAFTERWTLALDGAADAPWRVVVTTPRR